MMIINIKNKGFTIIELLLIVVIFTIILVIVIPNFIAYQEKQKQIKVDEPLAYVVITDNNTYIFDDNIRYYRYDPGIIKIITPGGKHFFSDFEFHIVNKKHPIWNDLMEK